MPATPHIQFCHCLICDDVRQELGSKETIVGVYTSGILVPTLPWFLDITIWLAVIWSGDGLLDIELQILDPQNKVVVRKDGSAQSVSQGAESSLAFRQTTMQIEGEGIYGIQARAAFGEWLTIKRVSIGLIRE